MLQQRKNPVSTIALFIIFITCALVINEQVNKPQKLNVIQWDIQEYYMYLPATSIYNDINFGYVNSLPDSLKAKYWLGDSKIGRKIGRLSIGMAVGYWPFFILAQGAAKIFGFPQNGYSYPYQLAVFVSGFFYSILGYIFLRKILLRHFSDIATALTLICIALGTNLFYYSTTEGPMSHAVLFCLFTLFLYFTIRWHENQTYKNIAFLFLAGGLAILIRPISIMLALIFILYALNEKNAFKQKLNLYLQHYKQFLLGFLILVLIALPQLIYWKLQSGNFIHYSYGDESFYFNDPKILHGLFGFRKGWLIYTPIMILSLAGFFFLRKRVPKAFLPVLLYVILHIYVIFCWWCWWYGGSFGMRAMIEVYALLALPMAALWQYFLQKQKLVFGALIIFSAACIYLNHRQTLQYRQTIIHWDSMSKPYYFAIFNKMEWPSEEKTKLLSPPDYEAAKAGKRDQ